MAKWIIVVDDDTANLKMAGHILSKNNMRVTAFKSGSSFLEYVNENGDRLEDGTLQRRAVADFLLFTE